MTIEEYRCPQCTFIKEEKNCSYCNNHKIKLVVNENENNELHFQISKDRCFECDGLGYKEIEIFYEKTRFGKTKRIVKRSQIFCNNCYKGNLVNIINFHKCDNLECQDGKVSEWIEVKFRWYDVFLWADFLFKEKVQEEVWFLCPRCRGTSYLETYDYYPEFNKMLLVKATD